MAHSRLDQRKVTLALAPLTLVLGGANSGKSAYAERLFDLHDGPRIYIATAQAFDGEMSDKIAAHVARRGGGWITREAPFDPDKALEDLPANAAVLLDCVTLWLSNLLLADHDLSAASRRLRVAIGRCPAPVVVVSNEVGLGVVPETSLGRRFRAAQGALNQELAAEADSVVAVMAGLPLVLKGPGA